MTINKAQKGANFERDLLNLALQKAAVLALRGASSKSKSSDPNLKVDLVIIKKNKIYLIQAKKHKKRASIPEKERFYNAVERAGLQDRTLLVESAFIENKEQLEILIGD